MSDFHGQDDCIPYPDDAIPVIQEPAELLSSPVPVLAETRQDITTWIEADPRAVESDYLLQISGQLARLGGWSVDLTTQRLQWSPQVYAIHGLPPGIPVELESALDFYAPHDQPRIRAIFAACIEQGLPFDQEFQLITAQGDPLWVRSIGEAVRDETGTIIKIQGAFQDITEKKQTEAALHLSRQQFRRFADTMPQILWTADPDGTVDYVNAAYFDYIGQPPTAEHLLDKWIENVYPDDIPTCFAAWQASAQTGNPYRLEFRIRSATGDYRWHLVTAKAVKNETGQISKWYGTSLDIHDRRLAEASAQALAQQLNTTLESISDGLFTLDREWQFTFLNSKGEYLLQRTRQDLLGRKLFTEFPAVVDTPLHKAYQHALTTGETVSLEIFYAPLDTWFEINAYPSPDGLTVYFRDVSERHRQDAQLQASEARFRAVARATADVIWDWDLKKNVMWLSEGFQTIFGYPPTETALATEVWSGRIHPDDRARVLRELSLMIETRKELWQGTYRFLHQNGSWRQVNDQGYLILDSNGQPAQLVGGMSDITDRIALEDQLRQSQRLESVGQLTGGLAHDFNNLLTVILGNAELLAEHLAEQPDWLVLATMIQTAAQRGAELTHRLLAYARRQTLDPQVVKVNELLTGLEPLLRRTLGANITIDLMQGEELWDSLIDPAQLESAILNLCINARDAMPEGGRLTLETSNAYLDQDYASQQAELIPGNYVLIAISDTGTGIPMENLHRVFEPFFTTKGIGKGTGLGLSMVYGFVKQSGGHVKLYSELESGTTVKLYLPRALQPADSILLPTDITGIPSGHETVLVVEDNDMVREYVASQLGSLGYQVMAVSNGVDALDLLEQDPSIDLLFTDVMMPGGINGRQLADRARRFRPELKVLYTSGYTESAIVHQGRLDPGVILLSKPYRLRDLAQAIHQVLIG